MQTSNPTAISFARPGADNLLGGPGNDTLVGGAGRDVSIGADDRDTFVLATDTAAANFAGADVILGFQVGLDAIALTDGLTEADLSLQPFGGRNAAIAIAESNRILGLVAEVTPDQLSSSFVPVDAVLF